MECEAVLKIRDKFGLTNLQVMIPFCRLVVIQVYICMCACVRVCVRGCITVTEFSFTLVIFFFLFSDFIYTIHFIGL